MCLLLGHHNPEPRVPSLWKEPCRGTRAWGHTARPPLREASKHRWCSWSRQSASSETAAHSLPQPQGQPGKCQILCSGNLCLVLRLNSKSLQREATAPSASQLEQGGYGSEARHQARPVTSRITDSEFPFTNGAICEISQIITVPSLFQTVTSLS